MNLLPKFVTAGVLASAMAALPAHGQSLTLEEQETLSTYRARSLCFQEHAPLAQEELRRYEQLKSIRSSYLRDRASELARQISAASAHIVVGSALSEGLSSEQTDTLISNLQRHNEQTLRKELERLVQMPPAPQTTDQFCNRKLNIDTQNFGRRVRSMTEKYGIGILSPPEGP